MENMGVAQRINIGGELEELHQLILRTEELVFGPSPEKELSVEKTPSSSKLDVFMGRIGELKRKVGRVNEQLELI